MAAAVAAGFIALTAGAIGQAGGGDQTGRPNNDDPTNNPRVNTHMSHPAYNSSLPGRTNAEENVQRVSDQDRRYNLREAYQSQNRQLAKTSHERTGSVRPMSREQGGQTSIQFRLSEAWPATACFP